MKLQLNYSRGKKQEFLGKYRFHFLILLPVFIYGVGPIMADQITGVDIQATTTETATAQSTIDTTPTPESIESPSPEASDAESSETGASDSTTESATALVAPSPIKIPPHAVENQNMILQIPRIQRLDPRAKLFNLPQVNFYTEGSSYMMLCMNSTWGVIDLGAKAIKDSTLSENVFIQGDLSNSAKIAGASSQVLDIFNSYGGLRLMGPDGKPVVGTNLLLRFVAISEPTDNFALCGESEESGQWLIQLQPLGLQVDTKKNPLNLGDKTRKP